MNHPIYCIITGTCVLGSLDLVIILDASTSVTEGNYKKVLQFIKNILRDADIDSGNVYFFFSSQIPLVHQI